MAEGPWEVLTDHLRYLPYHHRNHGLTYTKLVNTVQGEQSKRAEVHVPKRWTKLVLFSWNGVKTEEFNVSLSWLLESIEVYTLKT